MKQFIIIGNSAAGISAIEAIRKLDSESKIIVISDEDYPAYCRCLISYYISGQVKEEKILYRAESFYKDNNVELILNKKVLRVDPKKNRIICADKTQLNYDALLIATGSSPKFPENIKGIKKAGVFGLRTINDAKKIAGLLPVTKGACVLGGGLVGLKAAYALKKRNIDVKVIVKSKQVLSQMLDFEAAQLVQQKLEASGIDLVLGQDASEIISEEGEMKAVKLESGKALGVSMVIIGKGVSANIDLIKETEVDINQGIIVNNLLGTNIPNIYAAGDVAESFDLTLGRHSINALWPVAVEQGKVAGSNIAGGNVIYDGSLGMNSLELFGLPVVSLGIYRAERDSLEQLKSRDIKKGIYKNIILRDNLIVGAIFAGDIRNSGIFLRMIREGIDISSVKDKLLEENFGYPEIIDLVKDKEKLYV